MSTAQEKYAPVCPWKEVGGAKLGDKMVICLACNCENAGELIRANTVI